MKIPGYVFVLMLCLFFSARLFGQAVYVPRNTEQVVVKGFNGGTTTAGVCLSGSTTARVLQTASWTGSNTACIGFSNGVLGQLVVAGKVEFALGGLTPGQEYYLGPNGTVVATGTTTPGYINQRVIRAIGTNTAIINIEPPTTN